MAKKGKVLIASDHAAFELKAFIQKSLPEWEWEDLGTNDAKSVDYPDYAEKLSRKVSTGEADFGILACGSGIGMCIAANKVQGIRATTAENPISARLSREHNNTNVLCLGARLLTPHYALEIVKTWLETPFSEDIRHTRRLDKISEIEVKESNNKGRK